MFYAHARFSVEPIFFKCGQASDKAATGLILKQKKICNYEERGGERVC